MKPGIIAALLISLSLIGGASWLKFSSGSGSRNLSVVDIKDREVTFSEVFKDYETAKSAEPETLAAEEVLGRSLISAYISAASSGQVSEEDIEAIAMKYVEDIPKLNAAVAISYEDIKSVPDSQAAFKNYRDKAGAALIEFQSKIASAGNRNVNFNVLDDKVYSLADALHKAYSAAAQKLLAVDVPQSLTLHHLQLVNSYLSSAEAMKLVAQADNDAAKAFAGIVSMSENMEKEEGLINEIGRLLTSYEF